MDRVDLIKDILSYANENLVHQFTPGKTYIPAAAPQLLPKDVETLAEVLLNFWYTEWKYCRKFEKEIEKVSGQPFVSLVNSGSSASLIAISAALKFFDRPRWKQYVLTCAVGFPTTVSPIIQNGYTPIYVDMKDDLTPDMDQIDEALERYGNQIVGGVFAHTLGFPYPENLIRNQLGFERFLVSDCCDALGAFIPRTSDPVGFASDFSTLSFFPSHHVMAGEGGAVITNQEHLHTLAVSLANWGRSCYCRPGENNTCGKRFEWPDRGDLPEGWDHKYIFSEIGYNLKMTEFQGALGYSQIQRLPDLVASRQDNYVYLYEELARPEYEGHIRLLPPNAYFSPFGFPIMVTSNAFTLNEIVAYLEEHKIGTRRLFGGNLTAQPGFSRNPILSVGPLDGADRLMNGMFWISVSPSLNRSMLEYMVYTLDQFFILKDLV